MEKPLHVRVAEALGAKPTLRGDGGYWTGDIPIPRYDLDWSATGPLIERLARTGWALVLQRDNGAHWLAHLSDIGQFRPHEVYEARADTLVVAVCDLILALHAAGKLAA